MGIYAVIMARQQLAEIRRRKFQINQLKSNKKDDGNKK